MEGVTLRSEDVNRPLLRIDNPILSYATTRVDVTLGNEIVAAIGWTQHFDQEVGRPLHSSMDRMSLALWEENNDLRLNRICALEKDVHWSRNEPATQPFHHWTKE